MNLNRKSQVLIIFLWILVMLSVLSVGIGYRVSTGLKLNFAKRSALKAHYLANAGVNLAISEIKKLSIASTPDTLLDKWADNEDLFKKITINDNTQDFATVNSADGKYGVVDEERKININTASKELLTVLLEELDLASPEEVADNILIWRGDAPDTDKIYEDMGYLCKGNKFSNIEELKLVKGIGDEDFQKLSDIITVSGSVKLNINTVSLKVLTIFARSIAMKPDINVNPDSGNSLASNLIALRDSNGPFNLLTGPIAAPISLDAQAQTIFSALLPDLVTQSDNFLIEVAGNSGKIQSKISAIYNRTDDTITEWHES